jgi:putative sigma-54 modulation protein
MSGLPVGITPGGTVLSSISSNEGGVRVQVRISTRHGQLSDASQTKISNKVEKLSRIFDRLTSIDVTVDLENQDTPSVDLRVSAEHKHDFVATDRSSTLMGSLDLAIHKMEQQLRKYKEKIQNRHRNSALRGSEIPVEAEGEEYDSDEF